MGRPHELLEWLDGVERPFRAVYESGPSGYGLARRAREGGLEVAVCAPGHIARRPSDRVKTTGAMLCVWRACSRPAT